MSTESLERSYVGKYQLIAEIGRGGAATVYLAVMQGATGFTKLFVVKLLHSDIGFDGEEMSMFMNEARLAARLNHPNVVQSLEFEEFEGRYYLAMEYLEGQALSRVLSPAPEGCAPLRLDHHLQILCDALGGLHYAHELCDYDGTPLHIVHRDVSPPNIMLSKNGEVKIVDFGLAKANSQVEQTDQGVVKGKFSYLSPEAAWGLEVDARTDVFAIGIILWEMLSGRRLFYGDTAYATVELVREARVPSLTALNPNIDAELDGIVRTALARDPAQRFQSAADVGDALAHYLFAREWKVTSRDVANLVRDGRVAAARSGSTRLSLIDALVADERAQMLADVAADLARGATGPSNAFGHEITTTSTRDWAAELGLDQLE